MSVLLAQIIEGKLNPTQSPKIGGRPETTYASTSYQYLTVTII